MIRWWARAVAWVADEAAELGCACYPARFDKGVWIIQADEDQKHVLDQLRTESGFPPLLWQPQGTQ